MIKKLNVGVIVRPKGLKGEVKVACNVSENNIFSKLENVFVEGENKNRKVLKAEIRSDCVILQIEGINSIECAQKLRGKILFAAKDEIIVDGFLFDDLIGLSVEDENGKKWGKITEVFNSPASDIVEIFFENNSWLVPFVEQIFTDVSIQKGFCTVDEKAFLEGRVCN